jgi:integrase
MDMTGKNRRTLYQIDEYPTPDAIYEKIQKGEGWPYKSQESSKLLKRDRAFCALLYLLALRISEGCRLLKSQFSFDEKNKTRMLVKGIKLSKVKKKGHTRKIQFRTEAWIDIEGPRAKLASLVTDYLKDAPEELFIKAPTQARKYVTALIGLPPHWLRAFGENYLYDTWDHDIIAVANYVAVDPRTLQEYIRKGYAKYKNRPI